MSKRLKKRTCLIVSMIALTAAPCARADRATALDHLRDARTLYQQGKYFSSARYAFAAQEEDSTVTPEAYAWVTLGLVRAGLYNSASYFFIKTLQTRDKPAIRQVLTRTEDLLVRVGADLLRKYLIRHTTYADYDALNRSAYLYALGKDALLDGRTKDAVGYLNGMSKRSPLWPFALQLRGAAHAILGETTAALQDYRECEDQASDYVSSARGALERRQKTRESEDLQNRCIAGQARVLYEQNKFDDADETYDRIPKASFVYTDILFEQAWNSFAKGEFNRSLGKLVSYKSPGLSFVFNPEVDVLRAQSYLALCLYADANVVVNEFNGKYTKVGEQVKRFVERNSSNLYAFYDFGSQALRAPLHTHNDFYRMANRFVRGPYFQNLVAAERSVAGEREMARRFSATLGSSSNPNGGFAGFLDQVLNWRIKSIRLLGGAYVKNSLMDYHSILVSDFEKMAYIKLEMLSRAKDKLLKRPVVEGRVRGNVEPSRRDDQTYWSFNGEFWNDEVGDYVFGLESECHK